MAVNSSLGLTTKMPAIWLHEKAYEIIGTRVTHAIAECIPQTRDSNRGYQERLDYCSTIDAPSELVRDRDPWSHCYRACARQPVREASVRAL